MRAMVLGVVSILMAVFAAANAFAQELPYTCLPAVDADAVHVARGDQLVAHKPEAERVMFLWETLDGDFLIVSVDRATLEACIVERTPYDPRDSVSG